jgi:hypothetical protein
VSMAKATTSQFMGPRTNRETTSVEGNQVISSKFLSFIIAILQ